MDTLGNVAGLEHVRALVTTGPPASPKFSKREEQIFLLSVSGLSDREIAEKMGLSPDTVRTYWKRIRRKVGRNTRSEIMAQVLSVGEVRAPYSGQDEALSSEISRRKNLESVLKVFRRAFEVSGTPQMILQGAQPQIYQANNKVVELLGFAQPELVGHLLQEFMESDSFYMLQTKLASDEVCQCQCQYRTKAGSLVSLVTTVYTPPLAGEEANYRILNALSA
jgi:DNA-binding CsgD family transcriptional regulator